MLDPFEPLIRRVLEEWPEIKAPRMTEILREHGYEGSVDVVNRRLRQLRPRREGPAQRTGYRPGQVLQLDWAELPTRPPKSLAASGASTRSSVRCPSRARVGALLLRHDARVVP
jgi:transposase